MNNTEEYQLAKKRVSAKKGFLTHFGVYLAAIGMLVLINLFTFHGKIWFVFPAVGWGFSVAMHYLTVFGLPGFGDDWETNAIQKELYKIKKQKENMQQLAANERELEDYEELDLQERVKRPKKRWDDFV